VRPHVLAFPPVRSRSLRQVALDWLEAPGMRADAPVLLILHTITGTSRDFIALASLAAARGWRAAVCLRRGHLGTPLTAPRVNLLGCTADLRAQIAAVAARLPDAPLLALGASAGTGLLVRYLGEEGPASTLTAAVAVCPGYDTGPGKAFSRFSPLMDKHILASVKRFFLRPQNKALLAGVPGYAAAAGATSIAEYQKEAYALEGYGSVEEMFKQTNPMGVAAAIRTPLCVFNAADDAVCSVQARASCVLARASGCALR
jgi:predicted alpha/beta-fold hydrolase